MLINGFHRVLVMLFLSCVLLSSCAQAQTTNEYKPRVGQEGQDVIWVPTPQSLVDGMLDMAKVTAADYVIDLGSGDGRTVITAAKRGATALGIEYNPDMVELSKRNAAREKVTDKATFVEADIFASDFSKASVITMFLLPDLNLRLRPKILDLKPGTRIVSNTFTMGEWAADQVLNVRDGCQSYCRAYFWIVPAKIDGRWLGDIGELHLQQSFQTFKGTLTMKGTSHSIIDGKLEGDRISFSANNRRYSGRVNRDVINGSGGGAGRWSIKRVDR